jgi:putative ABC transport system substrate-binding protein
VRIPRRAFIETCAFGLVARNCLVNAQTTAKSAVVGWLSGNFAAQPESPPLSAFREGLRELGYVVGQNVVLDVESPQRNEAEEYPRLAAKLVARRVDIIVGANPHSLEAVTKATSSIPIVGVDLESDPVAKGWVASLARPGRNTTGFFLDIPEISGKQLQFLREVQPALTRVAILGDPRINELQFRATEAAARSAGLTLQLSRITSTNEIQEAIAKAAAQRAGGLVALTSPLVNVSFRRIADAALEHRLPSICGFVPGFAEAGGLLAYGPDFADLFRRAAGYVAAVLKGTAPGQLPVQRPTKFQLVINRKTAKVLRLELPPSLSMRADQVIE